MREYELIAARIADDRPARLLDWGCGAGQMTALLRARGLDVTAYDYRPGLDAPVLRPLEHYPGRGGAPVVGARRAAVRRPAFDAVLSCGVLEHVQDPDSSLEELKRVLVPGGTIYVYKLPNRTSYLEAIARTANRLGAGIYYHGLEPNDRIYTERSRGRCSNAWLPRARARPGEHGAADPRGTAGAAVRAAIWWLNGALAKVPGLRQLATNVELVADAPRP